MFRIVNCVVMDALNELCELICENPVRFSDKLAWICARCPTSELFLGQFPRVTRSQLDAVIAVALFVPKCPNYDECKAKVAVFEFFRSIPVSFRSSFWPQSSSVTAVGVFYTDFLGYVIMFVKRVKHRMRLVVRLRE